MMVVLLMIASGNVASLLVARATAREREIAVRLSLGAGRLRLIRQFLVESMLLGLAGGAVGLGLAVWGRDLLLGLFVSGQTSVITLDTGIDWRVMAFAVGTSFLTGLLCGMLPALRSTRVPVSESLKLQSRAVGLHSRRTLLAGRALVVAQMAFCLLLLVVAGLFVRSLRVLATSEIGFDRHHVLGARVDVRSLGYSADERQALYRRLLDRVQALPGVESASLSQNGPVITSSQISGFSIEGYTPRAGERMSTNEEIVTEDYFSTVGLRIVRGRPFGPADRSKESRATLINETMARRFFPGQDPIGKRWSYDTDGVSTPEAFVIVGVVEDAKYRDLKSAVPTMTYHLSGPSEDGILGDLEVRTAGVAGGAGGDAAPGARRSGAAAAGVRHPADGATRREVALTGHGGGATDVGLQRDLAPARVPRALRDDLLRSQPARGRARVADCARSGSPSGAVARHARSARARRDRKRRRVLARLPGGAQPGLACSTESAQSTRSRTAPEGRYC